MIWTLWSWLNVFVATSIMAPLVVLGALVGVRDTRFYDWAGQFWSRWILGGNGIRVHVEGLENIDRDAPQVLVGNHQSWYDVWALAASLPKRYYFVAKKELESIPIFGRAWKAAGHISIDRTDQGSAISSLDKASQQIKADGGAVVIFAEGTRSPTDDLLPFKKGAFMLALRSGVPIIPFGIAGSRRVLPKGAWRLRRGPIILRFGEPIPTLDLAPHDRDSLLGRVRHEVQRLRDDGRRQLGPGQLEATNR